ncbi:MAG: NAD-dependent epimerase/dehydratase family protein [Paludibacteraceae bacterium]|nr:NAD-dependent epimerase/dehydratase family protein [Paludibacteraceae bacterium]
MRYSEDYWKEVNKVLNCVPDVKILKGKSVLITGATGMICSIVVELLFKLNMSYDANILIYLAGRSREKVSSRFVPFKEGTDFFYVKYDATSECTIEVVPDYIIHGASPADPASFIKQPVETMLANLWGLKTLLDLTKQNPMTRLLFISSSEIYGQKKEKRPFVESDFGYVDILNPRACYPSSKRAAETMCSAYHEEYGVDFVIVRPGHIYGPSITEKDSRASAQFIRNAKNGDNIIMKSSGSQLRSYCYTLDCASAILTVLLKGRCGEAYNISNPQSVVTLRELADCLAMKAGVITLFEEASDQELSSYNMMDNSSLNSNKLMCLGWKSCFNLDKGIESTLKHYK